MYLKLLSLRIEENSHSAVKRLNPKVPDKWKAVNKPFLKEIRKESMGTSILLKSVNCSMSKNRFLLSPRNLLETASLQSPHKEYYIFQIWKIQWKAFQNGKSWNWPVRKNHSSKTERFARPNFLIQIIPKKNWGKDSKWLILYGLIKDPKYGLRF